MRFFFDTEFSATGLTIVPISYGLVADNGQTLYLVNRDVDWSSVDPWLLDNVRPYLTAVPESDVVSLDEIASRIAAWVASNDDGKPIEFWAYNAPYDWVALVGLYGRLLDRPDGWPKGVRDIKELCRSLGNPNLPAQEQGAHDALADALWAREVYLGLVQFRRQREVERAGKLRRQSFTEAIELLRRASTD